MNLLQYYWHRTANIAIDVSEGISRFCHWSVNTALSNETVNFHAMQFIEGVKTISTFPLTASKMIFHKPSRKLAAHILEYNLLYYVLPVVSYHGFLRYQIENILESTCGDYIFYVDLFASAVFTRALINAYAVNIFNNINAGSTTLPQAPTGIELSCSCKESQHLKAQIMSPIYYLTKMAVFTPLECIPYVGPVIRYTLKPLAWGEALNEGNISGLCHDHRIEYCATRNAGHYGMGMAVVASTAVANAIVTYYTGVSGFFMQDAIFNTLYPFMIFHSHNLQFETNLISDETPKDISKPIRWIVNQGQELGKSYIASLKPNDNNLLGKISDITQKLRLRNIALYPSFGKTPKELVKFPPLNMLLRKNHQAISNKLDTIQFVTEHPDLVANFLFFYQWLPLLPPKNHTRVIVSIMTNNIETTMALVENAKRLIKHAISDDLNADRPARVKCYTHKPAEQRVIEDYLEPPQKKAEEILNDFHDITHTPPSAEMLKIMGDFHEVSPSSSGVIVDSFIELLPDSDEKPHNLKSMSKTDQVAENNGEKEVEEIEEPKDVDDFNGFLVMQKTPSAIIPGFNRNQLHHRHAATPAPHTELQSRYYWPFNW